MVGDGYTCLNSSVESRNLKTASVPILEHEA